MEETSVGTDIRGMIPKKRTKVKPWCRPYYSAPQWKKKREAYDRYLKSGKWKTKRRKILTRCGAKEKSSIGICERCGEKAKLEVHHTTYERIFKERLTDLMGVCRICHRILDAERRLLKRLESVC